MTQGDSRIRIRQSVWGCGLGKIVRYKLIKQKKMIEDKIDEDISLFLPYDLKKNPSFEGIKNWSLKKYKAMKYLSYILLFIAGLQALMIDFNKDVLDNISWIAMAALLMIMSVTFHQQKKKYLLSDNEINNVINYYKSKHLV